MHRRVPLGRLAVAHRDRPRRQAAAGRGRDDLRIPTASRWRGRPRCGSGSAPVPDAPTDPRRPPIATPAWGSVRGYQPRSNDLNGFIDAMEIARRGRARSGDELVPRHQAGDRRRGALADRAPRLGVRLHRELGELPRSELAGRRSTRTSPINLSRAPRGEWTGVATRAWYSTGRHRPRARRPVRPRRVRRHLHREPARRRGRRPVLTIRDDAMFVVSRR